MGSCKNKKHLVTSVHMVHRLAPHPSITPKGLCWSEEGVSSVHPGKSEHLEIDALCVGSWSPINEGKNSERGSRGHLGSSLL